jgi:RNA polymerase sigma-70 factor (sigma-E family)
VVVGKQRRGAVERDFAAFVGARQNALRRSAWLLTGDVGLAEDLVQTALVKSWPHWPRLMSRGGQEAYVRRVMVTTYISWWRRKWRAEVPGLVPDSPGPDGLDAVDLREPVRLALAGLPRRQRAAVVLRFFDDLPEAQVAAALGCSVGTVKSQTSRALARLRALPELRALLPEGAAR